MHIKAVIILLGWHIFSGKDLRGIWGTCVRSIDYFIFGHFRQWGGNGMGASVVHRLSYGIISIVIIEWAFIGVVNHRFAAKFRCVFCKECIIWVVCGLNTGLGLFFFPFYV